MTMCTVVVENMILLPKDHATVARVVVEGANGCKRLLTAGTRVDEGAGACDDQTSGYATSDGHGLRDVHRTLTASRTECRARRAYSRRSALPLVSVPTDYDQKAS
jgi:hypothetical protein